MTKRQSNAYGSTVVPADPGERALERVGWRRTGLLQRLVKVEAEAEAAETADAAEATQRRAA
jgi:hypothetical protein